MKLIRSITTVGGYTIGSRIFGFVREILTASFLGAGPAADALVLAIKLPSFFRRLFAEGAFNASFVPLFAGILASQGEEEAKSFARQIFTLLSCVLLVLVVVIELFLPSLLPALLPGFKETPERLHYAIEFTRITFPFILFISLTALYSGILNSFDKFAMAASSPIAGNVAIILTVLLLHGSFESPGYAFAYGITLCGVVQLAWVLLPAWGRGMGLGFCRLRITPPMKSFFKVMAPAAFGSGVVQINLFIGAFIASWLPTGAISYLNYADRLNQLPLSVIGVAVSTALLPLLSRQIRQGHLEEAHQSQQSALEFSLFLALPAMVGLICLAQPLIMMTFERQAFTADDTYATALTLQAFALGLPAYVMIKIFSSSFFARQDTKTPLMTAAVGIVIDIILSVVLMGTFQQVGIAFATAVAAWVNAILLAVTLYRQGHLVFTSRMVTFLSRSALSCVLTAFVVLTTSSWMSPYLAGGEIQRTATVFALVLAGVGCFVVCAHMTGAMRFGYLRNMFRTQPSPHLS